ncbi:O-antigen ligase family protein [Hymenobacter sp. J193]|uniref:O-antigen ligase family protein n=1 Tax=Hymenobacter sp. J193 TaxID=2898429 RepID=UPI002151835C|nr:O-antigen ligase family protein [Hymenobacter sp. J193]MCR5889504.1 O-antigen ligase family protein [Hymenobacter sp. J193]
MLPRLPLLRRTPPPEFLIFGTFVLLLVGGGAWWLLRGDVRGLLPGLGLLAAAIVLLDWRLVFYLFLFTLGFSHEFHLPGGLAMDVPSEPLMLVLLACVPLALLFRQQHLSAREWQHPLLLLLLLQLLWAGTSALTSVDAVKSVKFLLAKLWYLVPFVLGTLLLLRNPAHLWRLSGVYALSVCITVVYTAVRHAGMRFGFDAIHPALQPFYRNHVIYATVLALLLPYALYGARAATHWRVRRAWRVAVVVLLFGLLTSYTRASFLSLPAAAAFYLVLRWRQTRLMLATVVVAAVAAASYFAYQSNFMRYAPDFEQTVFNGHNFEKHLEATYELKDVSGMERLYRWVAAARMAHEKPWLGSGPSTFYPEYKRYTVKGFRTYVSNNPEHSTTHNYFLLLLAEQGVPGCGLFLLVVGTALLLVERLYHRSARPEHRRLVLAAGLSFFIIVFHLLLNELVEVDKIGSFFFVALAALVRLDVTIPEEAPQEA